MSSFSTKRNLLATLPTPRALLTLPALTTLSLLPTLPALLLAALLTSCLASCSHRSPADQRVQASLARLDSAIALMPQYGVAWEARLSTLKQKAASATDAEARYFYTSLLIDSYTFYEVDSALHYVQQSLDLARESQRADWTTETLLAQARVCSSTGYMDEARDLLDQVKLRPMTEGLRMGYYLQEVYYWTQHAIYKDVWFEDPVRTYCDSILAMNPPADAPQTLWARFYREEDDVRKEEVRHDLINRLTRMRKDDIWYPRLTTAAGILSQVLGHEDDALVYLIEGLCADMANVRRLLPTLSTVASIVFHRGDIDRAMRYSRAYLGIRDDYTDHLRAMSLSNTAFRVYGTTIQQLEHDSAIHRYFIASLLAGLLLLLALVMVTWWLLHRQVRLRRELAASHDRLEDSLQQLQLRQNELHQAGESLQERNRLLAQAQQSLQEANYLKEEYIGQLFSLCSEYMERVEDIQRTVSRKFKAKQWDDLSRFAAAATENRNTAQKEFYERFDAIFLGIFPDFVEEFNGLLRPEERITLRRGERLNTDLRIYALVRLGINNSVKIARILGVSAQTVYNARMKMRTLATESTQSLPERVRALGHWTAPAETEEQEVNRI